MQFYEHVSASNTLGRIDPSLRDSWLLILIIILYKVIDRSVCLVLF